MSIIKTIPPIKMCFSCGNELPESDFDLFHELTKKYVKEAQNSILSDQDLEGEISEVDEIAIKKLILDSKLSKVYIKLCCRTMFFGDPIEYRRLSALYDTNALNLLPRF